MQAVLLAGGLGTRLKSVVSDRPKPMALIEGRPFMEYVVHELCRQGIEDIVFAVISRPAFLMAPAVPNSSFS